MSEEKVSCVTRTLFEAHGARRAGHYECFRCGKEVASGARCSSCGHDGAYFAEETTDPGLRERMEMARDRVREVEEAWGVRGPVELTEPDRGREKVSK